MGRTAVGVIERGRGMGRTSWFRNQGKSRRDGSRRRATGGVMDRGQAVAPVGASGMKEPPPRWCLRGIPHPQGPRGPWSGPPAVRGAQDRRGGGPRKTFIPRAAPVKAVKHIQVDRQRDVIRMQVAKVNLLLHERCDPVGDPSLIVRIPASPFEQVRRHGKPANAGQEHSETTGHAHLHRCFRALGAPEQIGHGVGLRPVRQAAAGAVVGRGGQRIGD